MDVKSIMNADPNGEELVRFAEQTAIQLYRDDLKSSQIRTIFTEVRKIETMWANNQQDAMRRLNMLKPKLDYQTKRNPSVALLRNVLGQAIDEINRSDGERNDRFERFVDLFEAILAYHRAHGGG